MDQSDLIKEAGVDPKTVRGLEKGTRWPRDASLFRIEVALGMTPGTIKRWKSSPESLSDAESAALEQEQSEPEDVAETNRLRIIYLAKVVASLSAVINDAAQQHPELKELAEYSNGHVREAVTMALAGAREGEADELFSIIRTWIGAQNRPPRMLTPGEKEYVDELLRWAGRRAGEKVEEPTKRKRTPSKPSTSESDGDSAHEPPESEA